MRNIVKISGFRKSGRTTYLARRTQDRIRTLRPVILIATRDVLSSVLSVGLPKDSLIYFINSGTNHSGLDTVIIKIDNGVMSRVRLSEMLDELECQEVDILVDNALLPRNRELTLMMSQLEFKYFAYTNLAHLDKEGEELVDEFISSKDDKAFWRTSYFIKDGKSINRRKSVWER